MELKRVGTVTMGGLGRHVLRQINDNNCFEGAAFDTHTTTDAELLGDEADG